MNILMGIHIAGGLLALPAGSVALPMDSTSLKRIRLDSAGTRTLSPRLR